MKENLRLEHTFNAEAGIIARDRRFDESSCKENRPETGGKITITDEEVARAQ